jgi:hypothetical protein
MLGERSSLREWPGESLQGMADRIRVLDSLRYLQLQAM